MVDQDLCYLPVSNKLVQAKVCYIYEDLSKDDDSAKPFNATSGWFRNFMKIIILLLKWEGNAASFDIVAAEEFVKELHHIIQK